MPTTSVVTLTGINHRAIGVLCLEKSNNINTKPDKITNTVIINNEQTINEQMRGGSFNIVCLSLYSQAVKKRKENNREPGDLFQRPSHRPPAQGDTRAVGGK